jgi:hypothetical protein
LEDGGRMIPPAYTAAPRNLWPANVLAGAALRERDDFSGNQYAQSFTLPRQTGEEGRSLPLWPRWLLAVRIAILYLVDFFFARNSVRRCVRDVRFTT